MRKKAEAHEPSDPDSHNPADHASHEAHEEAAESHAKEKAPAHAGKGSRGKGAGSPSAQGPSRAHPQRVHPAEHDKEPAARPVPAVKKEHRHRLRSIILVILILMVVVAGLLAWRNHEHVKGIAAANDKYTKEGPLVETAKVERIPEGKNVVLEGESRPFAETTLYAKVSGYLSKILVDEGTPVKAGQLLAVITSPETDQAFFSAQADYRNKERIARRYRSLAKRQLVSAQEAEMNFTAAAVAKANLGAAAQAREYEYVRAPFDGRVTSRFVDPGTLVANASNGRTDSQALLTVSDTDHLKINAYVDQKYAPSVHVGLPVKTYLAERMNEKFDATVGLVSGTLDRRTRMLPLEIDFDNHEQKIVSGSYVQIEIALPTPSYFAIPVEALVVDKGKPAVAIVGQDKKLKFTPIDIIDNDGSIVSVAAGVKEGDILALNIGEAIHDGQLVRLQGKAGEGAAKEDPSTPSPQPQDEAPESADPLAKQAKPKDPQQKSQQGGGEKDADQKGASAKAEAPKAVGQEQPSAPESGSPSR